MTHLSAVSKNNHADKSWSRFTSYSFAAKESIAPLVKGRLVVFFPGTYENNNYRLLDGYDGWSYLAIPITSDNES